MPRPGASVSLGPAGLSKPLIRFLRITLSLVLLTAGALHLLRPALFLPAMPDYIPWHSFWVAFTGLAEIAAAIGLWLPRLARVTAGLLMIFFVAILPAHLHVAQNDIPMFGLDNPWLWVRIPFQAVFLAGAWILWRQPLAATGDRP